MKPGIHDGVPEEQYHADPALSQSQAKTLLDCPARYRWELDHPREPSTAFDVGHAAHAKVLGVGSPVVVIDAESWRTKAAKDAAEQARADGATPLLRADAEAVDAMAEAVLAHPMARAILEADGAPEQSLAWTDADTGIDLRGRVDWLTVMGDGTPFLADLKTSVSADPRDFGTSIHKWGYGLQSAWYRAGYEAITGTPALFGFIVVEKAAPHFVSVGRADDIAEARGAEQMRDALDLYRTCVDTGHWPAYPDDLITYPSPRWA